MLTRYGVPFLRIALLSAVAAAAIAVAMYTNPNRPAEAAPAILNLPAASCGETSAQVVFNWAPVDGAIEQWLDVSTQDNHFAPGTYTGYKLTPGTKTLTATLSNPDAPYFWRVNSRTLNGWEESKLGQFVPCGGPQLLWGPTVCKSSRFATVDFNWAPRADAIGYQWLELSNDASFTGNVVRVGPLSLAAQSYTRGGFPVDERTYFRIAWEDTSTGARVTTPTASFVPDCTVAAVNTALYSSSDRLVSTSLGINAPVNVRDVGFDGFLGVPAGAYDVVRYNFVGLPGLRGYPGDGGVTAIGGHVDYYSVGLAIFGPLRSAQPGMSIEYHRADGQVVRYVVDWVRDIPFNQSLNSYLSSRGDALLLVTCNGTFDVSAGRYDLRRLVHATRVN